MESKLLTGTKEVVEKVVPPVGAAEHAEPGSSFWVIAALALACLMWGRRIRRLMQ